MLQKAYLRVRHWPVLAVASIALTASVTQAAVSQPSDAQCGSAFEFIGPDPAVAARAKASGQPIYVVADSSEADPDGNIVLQGQAAIVKGDRQLNADEVTFNRDDQAAVATGAVVFGDSRMMLEGTSLQYNLEADQGTIENASYALREKRARGRATRIIRRDASRHTLEGAFYTTCPPGKRDWALRATKVDLDFDDGQGSARNVVLDFKGVPILYSPYFSFPLSDERKSGFLAPSAGNSDETGFEFRAPYYLNLAPNYDATITPRYMSKRGLMMGGLGRYLFRGTEGEIGGTLLPSDKEADRDRNYVFLKQNGRFTPRWTHYLSYNRVSDDQYFEDFGNNLTDVSTTHLQRLATTSYNGDNWRVRGQVETYQTLSGSRPYRRLPQLMFNTSGFLFGGLNYAIDSEFTEYDHPDLVDGTRIDLYPSLSLPWETAAFRVEPRLGFRYTQYSLNDQLPGRDDNPSRSVPIFSVDSGMFFERDLDLWGVDAVQTLEPRLFYLYIPNRDQDDIPLFDTSDTDFTFQSLFRTNRFSGPDRQGDANQVTAAVTSRILSASSGVEMLRTSLGQIRYLRDRQVGLRPGSAIEASESAIVGELWARLTRSLTARGDLEWDPDSGSTQRSVFGLYYRPDNGVLLNASYRMRRELPKLSAPGLTESLEQIDISGLIPLGRNWQLVGRSYYSLPESKIIESFIGLGYESCCWGARVVTRRYVRSLSGDTTSAILFELELKGLTNIGNKVENLLTEGVFGYSRDAYGY
ncbi:MAG TPA: LPS-assembly protein LptD [Gammaproteobacteria bacterium]|nr:LPS-assembly protein LptD [Gammaproteobacteria bacterium]